MDQPVALAFGRLLKERAAQNPLPFGRERYADRIVHAACQHRLQAAMVRARAENMRRAADKGLLTGPLVSLFGESAFAPVEPAIGAQERSVQIVGAAGQCLALVPLLAQVGYTVVICVGELPNARRSGDVHRA